MRPPACAPPSAEGATGHGGYSRHGDTDGFRNAQREAVGRSGPEKAEFDLYYGGWSTSTGDADWALRPLFATESRVPTSYNVSYFSNPDVDKAIAAGLATADPAKRGIAYAQAQKLLWKEAPWRSLARQTIW